MTFLYSRALPWIVTVLTVLASMETRVARGELIFEFTPSNAVINVGDIVTVAVELVQTGPTTLLTDEGLDSLGVVLTWTGGPGTPSFVGAAGDILPNSAFDFEIERDVVGNSARLSVAVLFNSTVFPAIGSDRIPLGQFIFQAGAAGSLTTIVASDPNPDPTFDDLVSGAGTVLDSLVFNRPVSERSFTITVNPANGDAGISEPGTLALSLTIVIGGAAMIAQRTAQRRRILEGVEPAAPMTTA